MRRAAVAVVAAVAAGGCTSGTFLGTTMPRECRRSTPGPSLDTEYCVGWVMDQLLVEAVDDAYDDPALVGYTREVAARLARASGLRAPTVRIVDGSGNSLAHARPGGFVNVSRTLLALLDSEAELAAVIAHELAHDVAGHTADMVDRAPDPPGEHGLREAMARDDEATADELAVEYLAAAGYAPDAMKLALLALDRVEAAAELEAAARRVEEATAAAPGELVVVGSIADAISGAARKVDPALEPVIDQRRVYPRPVDADDPIHPALVERVARVTRLAAGRDGERGVDRYRARITGLVFGSDPRRGQVAGTRWSSTRLGLIAELPAGWRAEDDAPRVHLRAEKQEAILWPVGRGWGELAVDQLTGRRRLRIAGHPAVVGVQPVAEGATPTAKGPHLDVSATGPAPSKGSAVAVVFVGKRALVVYVHGAAAEAQLARLLAGIRRMTAAEHAAVEPPRLVFERAPRAATVGELVRELCARPDDARWLSDQTRRVEAGELVKCVE